MPGRLLLCLFAIVLAIPSFGAAKVLDTSSALDIKLEAEEPILATQSGPTVRGALTVSPAPIKPFCDSLVFYVDDKIKLATDAPSPKLILDTESLSDGEHSLRIEAMRGGKLVLSTGSVALNVANEKGSAVLGQFIQIPEKQSPPFQKLYRAQLTHEAIWFNGLEGDLERHAFIDEDRMYVTLTDLLRHVGGSLVWGPKADYIEVQRNDINMRLTPGSSTASVNNNPVDIVNPVVVRSGRTYVPARAVCDVLGVYIEWNKQEKRAYVYAPQPSYRVERREYPWEHPTTREAFYASPGTLSFVNHTGLPVHVLIQGNGFRADWQIRPHSAVSPAYVAAGTYDVTVWSRQGEDFDTHMTVASGIHDVYYIHAHTLTLHSSG